MEEFYILGKGKYSSKEFFNELNLSEQQSDLKLVFLPYSERLSEEYDIDDFNSVIISDEPLDENRSCFILQERDFQTKERTVFVLVLLIAHLTSEIISWDKQDFLNFIDEFKLSNRESLYQSDWFNSEELLMQSRKNISQIIEKAQLKRVNKVYHFVFSNSFPDNFFSSLSSLVDFNEDFLKEKNAEIEQNILAFFPIWNNCQNSDKFKISTVIV